MRQAIYHLQVEFGDCDPAGIVFYPNFYRWFDAATHHLFAAANFGWVRLRQDFGVVGIPLLETGSKYFGPASVGDRLAIESSVVEFGRKALRLRHLVRRDADLLVEGFEVRVLVVPHPDDPLRQRALECNDELRKALA